jgi:hypothetical protein
MFWRNDGNDSRVAVAREMIMAFALMVNMDGVELNTDGMIFRDIHRCFFLADDLSNLQTQRGQGTTMLTKLE